jgi:uncharacterized membrane protein
VVAVFVQAADKIVANTTRGGLIGPVYFNFSAIIAVKAIARAKPYKPAAILKNAINRAVGKPLFIT